MLTPTELTELLCDLGDLGMTRVGGRLMIDVGAAFARIGLSSSPAYVVNVNEDGSAHWRPIAPVNEEESLSVRLASAESAERDAARRLRKLESEAR